ncbi:MAG: FapA family protein, partial [Gracilibacteraceae bacterium]|nr:FapA family protein [Gracilibacteraceae bacterium]
MSTQIVVTVSEDRLKAWVTLALSEEEVEPVTTQRIFDALRAAGVVHGINEETVHALVAAPRYNHKEPVARATLPEKGQDAVFTWLFPLTSEGKPKVLPNGSVDYKQLDIIKNVSEGEPVCRKTPPTQGIPGTDVLGGSIEPSPGRDV